MKTVVRRLEISDLGHHHLCHEQSLFCNSMKTPACELYLVYSVTSFAARTGVNCAIKIFKDNLKISLNNNCIGVSAEFSKFLGDRKRVVVLR